MADQGKELPSERTPTKRGRKQLPDDRKAAILLARMLGLSEQATVSKVGVSKRTVQEYSARIAGALRYLVASGQVAISSPPIEKSA